MIRWTENNRNIQGQFLNSWKVLCPQIFDSSKTAYHHHEEGNGIIHLYLEFGDSVINKISNQASLDLLQ